MRLIRYFSLRYQGFSVPASVSLSSSDGDKTVGILAAIVIVWLLADSFGALL